MLLNTYKCTPSALPFAAHAAASPPAQQLLWLPGQACMYHYSRKKQL